MTRYIALLPIIFILSVAGCAHKHEHEAEEIHAETAQQTIWTSKTEIFVEYDELVAGQKSGFLIHVTRLSDFKPLSQGKATLSFTHQTGESFNVVVDSPAEPGIFKTDVAFKSPGIYSFKINLNSKGLSDEIKMQDIEVLDKKEYNGKNEEKEGWSGIALLKEQQWAVEFMTEAPSKRTLSHYYVVMGELTPASNAELTVSSPLSGIVSASKALPFIGKKVAKGDVLAVIEPFVQQQGGIGQLTVAYAEAKNRVVLAQNEYDRAKRLYEAKAVPKRRLEEAEISLNKAKAAFEPVEKAMADIKNIEADNKIIVRSPISGTVVEVMTSNGRFIENGQPIARVINTSRLHLRANVPVTEIGNIKIPDIAAFTIPGIDKEFRPKRLLAVNALVDTRSRTVSVIFEVDNQNGFLKAGMFANVLIKAGIAKDAMTLPESALFEDEGRHFVFVQRTGEAFERREVKTGIRDKGYVQIKDGINREERIVTKGGYFVKLASMSARMPQVHGHDHGHDHGHGHEPGHVH
jgi:RND family efflux transporter MFP subunit